MPIAIRSGGSLTGSSTNGGNITINLPAGTATGDVVYVMATTNGLLSMNTTGYTQVASASFSAGTENAFVFRKVMGATPDTTCVINGTNSAQDSMSAVLYVLTGVDTTTPEDATSPTGATGSSVNPNPPAIVTVTRTAWVLAFAATDVVNTISSYPSGYSGGISINANDNNDTTAAVAYKSVSPAGTEDPGTYTINATANWGAMTVAVRPAGFALVSVTGVSGTGQIGTVDFKLSVSVPATGVSGSGSIGTVSIALPRSLYVTGQSVTGFVGDVNTQAKAKVLVDGVESFGLLGQQEENYAIQVSPTGVSGTGELGDVRISFPIPVDVSGVSATGSTGAVSFVGKASLTLDGVEGVTYLGDVETRQPNSVLVTGVSGVGSVGSVRTILGTAVYPQGVYCTAQLSPVAVWITINDSQADMWFPVDDLQPNDWQEIPV